MATYWQVLELSAAPQTRQQASEAFSARYQELRASGDETGIEELQRAYDVALTVLSFEGDEGEASDEPPADDGLTLDDFVGEDTEVDNSYEYPDSPFEDKNGWFFNESRAAVFGGNVSTVKFKEDSSNVEYIRTSIKKPVKVRRAKITLWDVIASFYGNAVESYGRAPRREYWFAMLINLSVQSTFVYIMWKYQVSGRSGMTDMEGLIAVIWFFYSVTHIVPLIYLTVRRLHDLNLFGELYYGYFCMFVMLFIGGLFAQFIWLCFIPTLIWVILMAWPGTKGPNDYGPDPREVGL